MLTKNASTIDDTQIVAHTPISSVGTSLLVWLTALNFFRIGCQLVISAWSAVEITGRTGSVGHILLISSVTNLILSPFVGVLIDCSTKKKNLLIAGHIGITVSGLLPFVIELFLAKQVSFASVIVAAILSSVCGVFVGGSMDCFMKLSISSNERIKRLAALNSVAQIALIAGTAFGGCIVSSFRWSTAFLAIAACGLLLTLVCGALLPPLRVFRSDKINWRRGVFSIGPALYMHHHRLFRIACCAALAFSIGQVTNTLLPALMRLYLGLTGGSYSLVEASWSIGALAAGLAFAKFAKSKLGELGHDFFFILVLAGLLSIIPQLSWLPALLTAHLLLGAGFSFVRIRSETRFLTECPTHLLGRFRANSLFITSLVGLVVFATPTVYSDFSVPSLYQLLSGMVAISSIALFAFSRRKEYS
jgi:predicted MFS family arabinose efflux permease